MSRVPIVTLVDAASGLHVDISVGNTIARLKTLLLASYAALDPRARSLCFVVKRSAAWSGLGLQLGLGLGSASIVPAVPLQVGARAAD